ncbi:receptor-type tyrosine-protein phosphatase S-like isoform X3 [Acropora muricata]
MVEDRCHLVFRTFVLLCLAHLSSASCDQDSLGLENNVLIPDSWLTSSSLLNVNTSAKNGRLNYTGQSWCASSGDNYPYLDIDLQILHIICAVSTQGSHQADQWVKTFSLQSSTDGRTWTNYTEDDQVSVKIFSGNYDKNTIVKHILYVGIVAKHLRFVVGVKHGEACLRAAIFGAPRRDIKGNIALYKPTDQILLYETSYSSNAVDGGRQTGFRECSHCLYQKDPWWRVDLGRVEDVAEVHILSRNDRASEMYGAEIRVGDSTANGGAANHRCANNIRLAADQEGTFFCKPTASGRYVYIRNAMGLSGGVVVVCEVEVYSSYISNLALNQNATQSSVCNGSEASSAVDGNKNKDWHQGSCMHTKDEKDPWWRVDLGASLRVAEVVIVNRLCTPSSPCQNDMSAFEIRIGNDTSTSTSCGGTLSLDNGEIKPFYCDPPIVGRYVSVVVPGTSKVVNMCEVEVYSVRRVSNGVTACRMNSVGVSDSSLIYDQRFSASSSLSSSRASNGRLNGDSAWIPSSNNNNNDYLQIDLGSVYVVCAVATQGNPSANDWTETYKIETSLDNVNWQWYQENNTVKSFTGNSQKNEIVKNDLYNPPAVKFIRFYPVTNHNSKALRVEVYGSKQGCLSSVGNEESVPSRPFSVTASSQLDRSHRPDDSFLYGPSSWCSNPTASSPQYLQFDFRKVVTISGIATQGDAVDNNWVIKYAVSYGYDEQSWFDYAQEKHLTGNSDKSSVVVHWFSSPFAAQFVRILPKNYNTAQCMRVDLFGCRDFQVAFLYVIVNNATLRATHGASLRLNCTTKSSKQRPHSLVNEWRKDGDKLPDESGSSLTISYFNASDINDKYHCVSLSSSSRDIECTAVYQCSASLDAVAGLPEIKNQGNSTVTVILKKPGQVTGVSESMVTARTALVTWTNYSPGEDEAPTTSISLRYQNSTSPYHLTILPGSSSRKELINLKPFSKYNVTVMVSSVLGNGSWSNSVTFETLTATPEITIQVDNTTGVTSQSIYVEWKKPNVEKLNGPFAQYTIAYRESGKAEMFANVTNIDSTFHTLPNLKKWTFYFIRVRVKNRDHAGPWSVDRNANTQQDAPSAPQNLNLTFIKPTQNTRPQIRVTWREPSEENGIITKYTLTYSYNFGGVTNSTEVSKNGQTFEYTFDVLGGVEYTVSIYAATIKPGPNETQVGSVPVYKPSTAPFKIASQSYNETTYNISWDRLTREKSNGVVLAYEVNYTRVYYRGSPSSSAPRYQNTTNTMVTLQGLIACSTYDVLVRAYTSAGAGPFSRPLKIVTYATGPPSNVKAGTPGKRSITLTWEKPKQYGDNVQMYTVIYEGTKSYYLAFKHINSVKTEDLRQEITDLYPDTKYTFVVVATTHCGKGDNSTMVTMHTIRDAPPAPEIPEGTQQIKTAGSSVNLTIWAAAQDNGPISYYQILVHEVQDWNDNVSDWKNFGPDVYISAQIRAADVKTKMTFVLGDGKDKGGYDNKKLSSGQKYKIYARAVTEVTSKKRSTDKGLIGQAQLLAQVQVEAVETGDGSQKNEESSSVVGTVVPVVVVVLVVVIVGAIAGVIFWRRRRGSIDRSPKGSESHPMTEVSVNDAYDTIRPDNEDSQPKTPKGAERGEPVGGTAEPIYGNVEVADTEEKPKPIPVSQFSEYVTQMRREKNAGFAKQYKLLVSGQQFPWENAKKPVNKNKNRYANIIPYDHSRVILPLIDGTEDSDYVNASYLHGYDSTPNTYIACQGPVPGTYQDFWRMLWQENVTTVVMLTRLVEHGRTKCHQYWPDKAETYLDITVTNHKTETIADYAIRTFILQKKGSQERRQVQQFHFLVWPDKGVPRHATAVLALRRKVRTSHNSNNKNPLVVHCSAGVGRTGAFIVIDAMLESIEKKKVVDVFNYVKLLRVNRISMVQTEEQYAFIHMALLESVICGKTEIPAQDLRIALKKLVAVNPKTNMTGLAREYQRLELITADDVTDIKDDVGRQKENASKNRFPDILPLNGSRVILQDANNDYINASYVDTFRERNSFIMTQAPLENTIEDFWKMIWDYNIGTIVMLNEQKEGGQVYPMYWATEGSATFGEFTVETTSHEVFQDFSQREFSVAKKEVGLVDPQTVHQVHHYQITDWPDKGIPKNAQCILDMISMVEQSQRKTSNAPLVVQCSDGVGRSGTFCAILSVIERLKSEQVIDVCQSVKVIRVNRPKAVNCK